MNNNTPKQKTMKLIGIDRYAPLPIELLRTHNISIGAKMVYVELMSYAWFNASAYPGQQRMMYELGIGDVKTLRKYLNELKNLGLLNWEKKQIQGTNTYTLKALPKAIKNDYKKYEKMISEKKN